MNKDAKEGNKPGARSLARLLAIQALYLLRMNKDASPEGVVEDFGKFAVGEGEPVPVTSQIDEDLFRDLVFGVSKEAAAIRGELETVLKAPWTYERLEAVMAVIVEAGAYELKFRPDIPHAVIINEYVDVTHAFYEGNEPAFVNGILDELAKRLRG